jgi:hypothetical protein
MCAIQFSALQRYNFLRKNDDVGSFFWDDLNDDLM